MYSELADNELNYVWFDFHSECKKMKWENLSKLIDIMSDQINEYGNFICELNYAFDNRS